MLPFGGKFLVCKYLYAVKEEGTPDNVSNTSNYTRIKLSASSQSEGVDSQHFMLGGGAEGDVVGGRILNSYTNKRDRSIKIE